MDQDFDPSGTNKPPAALISDPVLGAIISSINKADALSIGLTLTVGGATVTGIAVSGRLFFTLLKNALVELTPSDGDNAPVLSSFSHIFGELAEHLDGRNEEEPADLPSFVHLRGAEMHQPGARWPVGLALWRGRLDLVTGWMFGNLADYEAPPPAGPENYPQPSQP